MKKLLGITIIGFYRITRYKLDTKEIKQGLNSLNKENASKLWKIIQEAGDYLGD